MDNLPDDALPPHIPAGPAATWRPLKQWNLVLHDDEINDVAFVVDTVQALTHLPKDEAINRTLEAHRQGKSLLMTTHHERAELYVHQFAHHNLLLTIEPA